MSNVLRNLKFSLDKKYNIDLMFIIIIIIIFLH